MFKKLILLSTLLITFFLKTSNAQINRIKDTERFSPTAYRDGSVAGAPKYSIGYGHQIGLSEQHLMTEKISPAMGVIILQNDVSPLEIQVNRACVVKPNQNQFDQFIDFGFNTGSGSLAKVLLTYNANPHNLTAVTSEMLEYDKTHDNATGDLVVSSDLLARRKQEVSIFNNPVMPLATGLLFVGVGLAYLFATTG
jgi:GH24 family phage-related lysozyme (muramidase)